MIKINKKTKLFNIIYSNTKIKKQHIALVCRFRKQPLASADYRHTCK